MLHKRPATACYTCDVSQVDGLSDMSLSVEGGEGETSFSTPLADSTHTTHSQPVLLTPDAFIASSPRLVLYDNVKSLLSGFDDDEHY